MSGICAFSHSVAEVSPMAPGLLLSILAGCLSHQVSPTYVITDSCLFELPILYNSHLVDELNAVEIWVSRDRGRSWSRVLILDPSQQFFRAAGPDEGDVWIGIRMVYRNGLIDPPRCEKPDSIIKMRFNLNPTARAFARRWSLAQADAAERAVHDRAAVWAQVMTAFWSFGSQFQVSVQVSSALHKLTPRFDLRKNEEKLSSDMLPKSPPNYIPLIRDE
jgi:hypothetical protein